MTDTGTTTLRQAVGGEPTASWTDGQGTLWTSGQILDQWSEEQLNQPVAWGEGQMGMPTIRHGSDVLLTMEPPTGLGIPSEPPVAPES